MKRTFLLLCLTIMFIGQTTFGAVLPISDQPDSVYLFSYATTKNSNTNGLHFAWSTDQEDWTSIGPEMRFLFCDYGRWGVEKRMITPFLFLAPDGMWHCVWSLNEHTGTFAHAESEDLIYWFPQTYPIVMKDNNCLEPEVLCKTNGKYEITWLSTANGAKKAFSVTTTDFKNYSQANELSLSDRLNQRKKVNISGNTETGTVHKVAWELVESLLNKQRLNAYRDLQWSETTKTDSIRFASLKALDATITIDNSKSKKISDMLIGVFFEDINYAADGGLYAELLQNRDFEYALSDKEGRDKTWNSTKAWRLNGNGTAFSIDSVSPIHANNAHYAVLKTTETGSGLVNEGFDGIAIKSGEKYNFSVFVSNPDKKSKKLLVRLIGKNGESYGATTISVNSSGWKKVEAVLTASQTATDAQLEIVPQTAGTVHLDMISLFPQKTFMGRKNGLRADLAQAIADIHPRFIRFPGGCVAHGDGIDNIYRWKNTVGPLESRRPLKNLWGYHQTVGLGYFEYFQFCEDIGAAPLPVIAAGVPCQNSATGGAGQQGGIPMCDMDDYVQEVLDLIEWANGDATTKWGKIRAEAGHPKPFNLKYVGIGNEDLINAIFEERFTMIFNAVKVKHPEITVIGTVGPSFEGTDYVEGWKIATKLQVPMVDEHYYQSPGWFIHNQDYYDKYDRSKPKVYLGEYASHLPGRVTNIETALSEALYLTACERNGDVVSMTSYAPLLAKEGHTQWNPDLIYFNNSEVKPTVDYFIQQLYGQNSGDTYLTSDIKLSDKNESVRKRVAVSVVRDSKSNDLIVKMVNMLPVAVNSNVRLDGMGDFSTSAIRTVLSGTPTDKKARPVTDQIAVSGEFPCTLPAYSFSVIRIKRKME
ncbi:MAG: carbohydrate binding domain-containing protein [Prolixibacteraceae bacterium]|nr:carbohydrate binding domain-containing protein [Prolixibacteraceae bacterium]